MKELEDLLDAVARFDAKVMPYFGPMLLDDLGIIGHKLDGLKAAVRDIETRYKALLDKEKGRK